MVIARGAIYWVDLGEQVASAPAKRRPVLVVQSNSFNSSQIATVVVAVITSKIRVAEFPGNVFVPATSSGLPRDSVVNVSQLVTLDRSRLGDRLGELPKYLVSDVDAGLRQVLAV
jgi:mRNA interferase MazF